MERKRWAQLLPSTGSNHRIWASGDVSVTEEWKAISGQDKTEKLLLPSEFINQPDFHCVIKVSGHGITEGVIPRVFFEPVATHFQDLYADEPLEGRGGPALTAGGGELPLPEAPPAASGASAALPII